MWVYSFLEAAIQQVIDLHQMNSLQSIIREGKVLEIQL